MQIETGVIQDGMLTYMYKCQGYFVNKQGVLCVYAVSLCLRGIFVNQS